MPGPCCAPPTARSEAKTKARAVTRAPNSAYVTDRSFLKLLSLALSLNNRCFWGSRPRQHCDVMLALEKLHFQSLCTVICPPAMQIP